MTACFKEMYRILKPNRWMTVYSIIQSLGLECYSSYHQGWIYNCPGYRTGQKQGSFKQVTCPGRLKMTWSSMPISQGRLLRRIFSNGRRRTGTRVYSGASGPSAGGGKYRARNRCFTAKCWLITYSEATKSDLMPASSMFSCGIILNSSMVTGSITVKWYEEWKKKHGLDAVEEGTQSCQQLLFVSDEKSALVWLYHFK